PIHPARARPPTTHARERLPQRHHAPSTSTLATARTAPRDWVRSNATTRKPARRMASAHIQAGRGVRVTTTDKGTTQASAPPTSLGASSIRDKWLLAASRSSTAYTGPAAKRFS